MDLTLTKMDFHHMEKILQLYVDDTHLFLLAHVKETINQKDVGCCWAPIQIDHLYFNFYSLV